MRGNISKGSEAFQFFADYYKFLGEYYEPENTEEYWETVIEGSNALAQKYKTCDFYVLAKGIMLVTAIWLSDCKFKGNIKGRWSISYREGGDYEQE